MQIKVIVQKSIIGYLIQLEEKGKVTRATCSDIHAHRKREKRRKKSKEQSWHSIIIKRFNYYKACGQREAVFHFLSTVVPIRPSPEGG